jgi:hypothetical protein
MPRNPRPHPAAQGPGMDSWPRDDLGPHLGGDGSRTAKPRGKGSWDRQGAFGAPSRARNIPKSAKNTAEIGLVIPVKNEMPVRVDMTWRPQ